MGVHAPRLHPGAVPSGTAGQAGRPRFTASAIGAVIGETYCHRL